MSKTVKQATIDFLKEHDAFWEWNGHKHLAKLASGKISNFFANCSPIFTDPEMQDLVADALVSLFRHGRDGSGTFDYFDDPLEGLDLQKNIWVIGSAMGAVGLAQSIARIMAFNSGLTINAAFTERVVPALENPAMKLKRFDLGEKPYVILCEDVVTTGGTTIKTIAGILEKHADVTFHPNLLTIVDRSSGHVNVSLPDFMLGLNVISIIDVDVKTWDTNEDLPDNMRGCIPIRPKGNWDKLVLPGETKCEACGAEFEDHSGFLAHRRTEHTTVRYTRDDFCDMFKGKSEEEQQGILKDNPEAARDARILSGEKRSVVEAQLGLGATS